MTSALAVGAVLCFVVGVLHSWLGERFILIRLFRRHDLPRLYGSDQFTRRTLRLAWHLTSLAWWGFGLLLVIFLTTEPAMVRPAALKSIALTFLLSSVLSAAISRGRHLSWLLFLGIALAAWFGA